MRTDRPSTITSTAAHKAGWIVSLLLHGTLAFGVFVLAQQITTRPQPVSFTWNVAMVTPPTPATTTPAASAQRSARTTEATTRSVPAEAALRPTEPLAPVGQVPPVPTLTRPITENIPPPIAEQTAVPRAMDHDSSRPTPNPLSPVLHAPPQPFTSAQSDSVLPTHDEPVAISKDTPLPHQTADVPEQHVATLAPSGHTMSTKADKADYGWLADLMAKWIGELDKRYPVMLRTEGITGRVTLTAVLHHDGKLSDVRVVKSSGNAVLDQVAVEDITNGPPVKLSRPLERPSMPVKFSIVYDLKTAR